MEETGLPRIVNNYKLREMKGREMWVDHESDDRKRTGRLPNP